MFSAAIGVTLVALNLAVPADRCWDLARVDGGVPQPAPLHIEPPDSVPHFLLPRGVKLFADHSAALWGYPHGARWRDTGGVVLVEPTGGRWPPWSLRLSMTGAVTEGSFTIALDESRPRTFHLRASRGDCGWPSPLEAGYLEWLGREPREMPFTQSPHVEEPGRLVTLIRDLSIERGVSEVRATVWVLALIDSSGMVLRAELDESSGNALLDQIALEVVAATILAPARFGRVAVPTWSRLMIPLGRRDRLSSGHRDGLRR